MIHLMKLSVGSDAVEDHQAWQTSQRPHWPPGRAIHVTRQRILDLQAVDLGDGIPRCALVLDATIQRTEPAPRRPFQGWRYLDPKDAPRDLPQGRAKDDPLPPNLALALAEIGLR